MISQGGVITFTEDLSWVEFGEDDKDCCIFDDREAVWGLLVNRTCHCWPEGPLPYCLVHYDNVQRGKNEVLGLGYNDWNIRCWCGDQWEFLGWERWK